MDENHKTFVHFLVTTGTSLGEAPAIQIAYIDLAARVPDARITKASKRDNHSGYYTGQPKTGTGKPTIGIDRTLANLLHPLLTGNRHRTAFTTGTGACISHKALWQHDWDHAGSVTAGRSCCTF
ncbi:hypothetical protein SB659_06615 [Arthrobacter sp. SIMBA_036]|uniref:hypothetical protein n=1 Tax=Arthrobacter sp. SIMBA_036 TaxID=3085778 RepID=UPI00397A9565